MKQIQSFISLSPCSNFRRSTTTKSNKLSEESSAHTDTDQVLPLSLI